MTQNNIAFTFASAEVNKIGQNFIKLIEIFTGKLKLKRLYDQYLPKWRTNPEALLDIDNIPDDILLEAHQIRKNYFHMIMFLWHYH